MNSQKKEFQYYLSEEMCEVFNAIENHKLLGASQQIIKIAEMFSDLIKQGKQKEIDFFEIKKLVLECGEYYKRTRGAASRLIFNSITKILHGLKDIDNSQLFQDHLNNNLLLYMKNNERAMNKVLEYGCNELKKYSNFMLFDYSSTVEKCIIQMAKTRSVNLYVPESAAIDGGIPYLPLGELKNMNVFFFPDAAIYFSMKKCDCILMGAETFYPDGTGFNTIGSDMVAVLSKILNVPLYFITPLLKLDIRKRFGVDKEIITIDYKNKAKCGILDKVNASTIIPELIGVDPSNIYAYITEWGVIPSYAMFQTAIKYYHEEIGDSDE